MLVAMLLVTCLGNTDVCKEETVELYTQDVSVEERVSLCQSEANAHNILLAGYERVTNVHKEYLCVSVS